MFGGTAKKAVPFGSEVSGRRSKKLVMLKKYYPLYIMFIPVLIYYILFAYIPMAGIVIAFKDYQLGLGIFESPWASEYGMHNFIRFLTNGEFQRVFKNTVILAAMRIFLTFPAPIIFALMLNAVPFQKYKRVLQTVSYLPHFVSFVVVYAILYNFFSYDGFINTIRGLFGGDPILYLGNPSYYRWLFIGSAMWKEMGWGAIIYLAALSRVNVELYEAADIDGATRWHKLWYITLNELRPIISIQFILTMGGLFGVSLDQTMVMTNDMVSSVSEVTSYYVYKTGILTVNQYSYASAIDLFNSILGIIMVLFTNFVSKKIDEDGGLW